MKNLCIVLGLLLAAVAMPTLMAEPQSTPVGQIGAEAAPSVTGVAPADATHGTVAALSDAPASAPPPAHKTRSRRPARIDLTMPYYRFGRLPSRIKD